MGDWLKDVRERVEKATPGPWDAGNYTIGADKMDGVWEWSSETPATADAAFIAHAREDIPRLLALVAAADRLAAEVDKLDGRIDVDAISVALGQELDDYRKLRGGE